MLVLGKYMKTVMKLRAPLQTMNLTRWETISFFRKTLLHTVTFDRTAGPMHKFGNRQVHNSRDRWGVDKAVNCAHVHASNNDAYFSSAANRKRLMKRVQ